MYQLLVEASPVVVIGIGIVGETNLLLPQRNNMGFGAHANQLIRYDKVASDQDA